MCAGFSCLYALDVLGIVIGLLVRLDLVILFDIKTRLVGVIFWMPLMIDVTMQYHLEKLVIMLGGALLGCYLSLITKPQK